MKKLTEKQQRFADYFIESGNATQAAIEAGYSERTARNIGSENLTKPNIRAYIDQRLEELASERIADQQEVLEYLTGVMRGEEKGGALKGLGDGYQEVIDDMPPTVSERTKAAELLGKRYGIWTEKVEVKDITPTFIDDVPKIDADEE